MKTSCRASLAGWSVEIAGKGRIRRPPPSAPAAKASLIQIGDLLNFNALTELNGRASENTLHPLARRNLTNQKCAISAQNRDSHVKGLGSHRTATHVAPFYTSRCPGAWAASEGRGSAAGGVQPLVARGDGKPVHRRRRNRQATSHKRRLWGTEKILVVPRRESVARVRAKQTAATVRPRGRTQGELGG